MTQRLLALDVNAGLQPSLPDHSQHWFDGSDVARMLASGFL